MKGVRDFWEAVVGDRVQMRVAREDGSTTSSVPFNPFALFNCDAIVARLFPHGRNQNLVRVMSVNNPLFAAIPYHFPYNPMGNAPPFPSNSLVVVEIMPDSKGNRASWGSCRKTSIIVREEYLIFIEHIFRVGTCFDSVMLTGPSGVGKTVLGWFLIAFLWKIGNMAKDYLAAVVPRVIFDGFSFLYQDSTTGSILLTNNAERLVRVVDVYCEIISESTQPLITLSDSYVGMSWHSLMHVFIECSNNNSVYRMELKWSALKPGSRINESLSPFSEVEHVLCSGSFQNGVCTNRNELQYLRDIFGGCLHSMERVLNPDGIRVNKSTFSLVHACMTEFFKGHLSHAWERRLVKISSEVIAEALQGIEICRDSYLIRGLFMQSIEIHRDDQDTYKMIFSSSFLRHLAMTIHMSHEVYLRDALKRVVGSSGYGFAYEYFCHETVMKLFAGGCVDVQSATDRRDTTVVRLVNSQIALKRHFIRSWKDINHMPDNSYGYPLTTTFPLLSGVVKLSNKDPIVFRATISEEHSDDDALNRQLDLHTILATPHVPTTAASSAVAAPKRIKFVYLLSKTNYDHFQPAALDSNLWEIYKKRFDSEEAEMWIPFESRKK